jgi:hypothetical protein
MFKVYCTNRIAGRDAPSLPPGAMPIALATEIEALDLAFRVLRLDAGIAWKVEYPDGTVVSRDQIEFIFRNDPTAGLT